MTPQVSVRWSVSTAPSSAGTSTIAAERPRNAPALATNPATRMAERDEGHQADLDPSRLSMTMSLSPGGSKLSRP